ncbi:MAG: hypothetical protein ACLP5H_11540 [Desulfomonilaceae bacterium]
MNLKFALIVLAILSLLLLSATGPVHCQRTLSLTVCQELVNSARGYEARSAYHNRVAKALTVQIQTMAKQPSNAGTVSAMDNLFAQYDENRAMEQKFLDLYRQVSDEANNCMKSVQ